MGTVNEDRGSYRGGRVQLIGFYGMGNFGDELFADTLLYHRQTLWPDASVLRFGRGPAGVYSWHNVIGRALRLLSMTVGGLWADRFVYGGGSVFEDVAGVTAWRDVLFQGRKREAFGVSIGPFKSQSEGERVATALLKVDTLVVRDHVSVQEVHRILPHVPSPSIGGDLAALSPLIPSGKAGTEAITVCPSIVAGDDPALLARKVRDALYSLHEFDADQQDVRLLALSSHPKTGDEQLCISATRLLRSQGIQASYLSYGDLGLQRTWDVIAGSKFVWSQRLHGAIAAYLAEVPFLIEAHHSKCRAFADDIGLYGGSVVEPGDSWRAAESVRAYSEAEPLWRMSTREYRARAEDVYLGREK